MAPIAFSTAGTADPRATGRNIGRVAAIGYVGLVSGPIVIGWLAEATSLRLALGITAVLALVIAAAARAVQANRLSKAQNGSQAHAGMGGDEFELVRTASPGPS